MYKIIDCTIIQINVGASTSNSRIIITAYNSNKNPTQLELLAQEKIFRCPLLKPLCKKIVSHIINLGECSALSGLDFVCSTCQLALDYKPKLDRPTTNALLYFLKTRIKNTRDLSLLIKSVKHNRSVTVPSIKQVDQFQKYEYQDRKTYVETLPPTDLDTLLADHDLFKKRLVYNKKHRGRKYSRATVGVPPTSFPNSTKRPFFKK